MKRASLANRAQVTVGLLFVVVVLVGLMFFAGFWRAGSSYTVSAYVPNARGIAADSTIFEAGLPVGLVTGVRRNGPDAILTMRIDHGPTPLPVDSKIELGLRSLAGETDVLLALGHSHQTVPNNGSLGLAQSQDYTDVDQILNSLSGSTEGTAREFFQSLGAGVVHQGQNLNNTIGGIARLVNQSPPLTSVLGNQRQQVADVVQYFGTVMGAISQRTSALEQFARGADTTFATLANRDTQLKAMLDRFPYMMRGVQNVGTSLANNTPDISAMVTHLSKVTTDLTPTIQLLKPGASSGLKVFRALGQASPQLKSLLGNLTQLKPSATAALPALRSLLCQVNPMVKFVSPYGNDIAAFAENFGSAVTPYVNSGQHPFLASITVDPKSLFRGVANQPTDDALAPLVNSGIFALGKGYWDYRELQPPGHRNDTSVMQGYQTPSQFGAAYPYPHVTANCN